MEGKGEEDRMTLVILVPSRWFPVFLGYLSVMESQVKYWASGFENATSEDGVVLVVFFASGLASIVSSVDKLMQSLPSSSFLWDRFFG